MRQRRILWLFLLVGSGLVGACGSCGESHPKPSDQEKVEAPLFVHDPDGGRATNLRRVRPPLIFDASTKDTNL